MLSIARNVEAILKKRINFLAIVKSWIVIYLDDAQKSETLSSCIQRQTRLDISYQKIDKPNAVCLVCIYKGYPFPPSP